MTSIKDVAETAGVSTATVSRVLSDKPYVRPEIRQRVMAAVEALGYRPNRVARSLRVQKTNIIGLIVSDIRNPFFTSVSRAVEDVAYEHGFNLFLCNADENPQKEAMYLQLMHDENVSGLILSPTRQIADNFKPMVKPSLPMVVIDRRVRGAEVDSVLIDNEASAARLVAHLIADGHQRIGALFGGASTTGRERREGYLKSLKTHGLKPETALFSYVKAREEDGYQTTKKLLKLPNRPDAILTSNAQLSAGAFKALLESNLAVPDDIAFASFDETTWTSLVKPGITVIEQPTYEIGQLATELLLERIKNPARPTREIILKGKLIVRQSCDHHRS